MKAQTLSRLAWVAFGFVALSYVSSLAFAITIGSGVDAFVLAMMSFPVVGVVVASRQPRNAIGWIMLAIGMVSAFAAILSIYSSFALDIRPGSLPRADLALILNEPLWIPFIAPIGTFLILLFPDGRLPNPHWRSWAWFCAIAMTLPFIGILVVPGSFGDLGYPNIGNPLGIEALRPFINILFLIILLIPVSIVGCAVALIQRFRRSQGQEQLQLKWLAAAGGVVASVYFILLLLHIPFEVAGRQVPQWVDSVGNLGIYVFILIPIALAVAILKYHLYDIDRIINRALVYGALTAILGAGYVVTVTLAGTVLKGSDVVTAGATLAVAALFRPLRARVQGFIDRRFYRRKYDAVRTVEEFSRRLRDDVRLEALTNDLVDVVRRTVQPVHVSLWLKQ